MANAIKMKINFQLLPTLEAFNGPSSQNVLPKTQKFRFNATQNVTSVRTIKLNVNYKYKRQEHNTLFYIQ